MKRKLGDLAIIVKSKDSVEKIDRNKYVTTENMISNRGGVSFPSSTVPKQNKLDTFDKDDVLVSNIRPYFKKIWKASFSGYKSGDVLAFRTKDRDILSQEYLYILLESDRFFEYMTTTAKGTKMPRGDKKAIAEFPFDLPSIDIQKKRSHQIEVIEQKISLNQQINANLYEQIKTISNSHFSYFDFSNGHIPSNWHYTSLSDVAEITTGYSYTSRELHSSKTAMATIKNFERTGGFSDKGYKEIIPQKKLKDSKIARKFDILVAHTDLTQNADIIGNAEIILDTSIYSQLIYSMDLVRVRTKATNVSQFLLSLILQGDRLKKHCLGYVNGTTVLHLSKKALKEFYIPLPNDLHELDHISKFAKAAYMNIAINIQENSMLQEAKQTLLRKFF